jgi:hypothetical protein
MMFRRRHSVPLAVRLGGAVKAPARTLKYAARRLARLSATPHAIALGAAIGVFVSFTPIIGLRFLVSAATAALARASVVAALAGANFGNPFVYPALAGACYWIGCLVIGDDPMGAMALVEAKTMEDAMIAARAVLGQLAIGIALLGSLTAAATYWAVRPAVVRVRGEIDRRRALRRERRGNG